MATFGAERSPTARAPIDTASRCGWITETDQTVRFDANGYPVAIEVCGITPGGDAAETLTVEGGKAVRKSIAEKGEVSGRWRPK